jgi:hypothetical protein
MGGCLLFVIALALEYLLTAGLVWVGCWALGLLGITVVWSWTLALGAFVLVEIIRILF